MFDEKEYREVFSQVKASQDLIRRVMTMKAEKKVIRFTRAVRIVFVGALLCSMLALTAFAYTGFVVYENPRSMLDAFFGENNYGYVEAETITYDKGEAGLAQWQAPEQVREPVDETLAQELIAPHIAAVGQKVTYEDYTMTIVAYSFETETNTALLYYTIENPNGVTGYSLQKNGELWWPGGELVFCNQSMKSYIIQDETTENKLSLAGYVSILESGRGENIYVNFYPNVEWNELGTRVELVAGISLSVQSDTEGMDTVKLANDNIVISPMSIVIYGRELGLMNAGNETRVHSLLIRYIDGTEYLVLDEGVMNYAYGTMVQEPDGYVTYCLNQIVDLKNVCAVVVNGTEYLR
jgi:hypothetical protein